MFLAPNFFWGGGSAPPPGFLEWDYNIQPDSDHVAKFQGDRSRELGERVAKKKHMWQNISPSGTVVPGGLKIVCVFRFCLSVGDGDRDGLMCRGDVKLY